jgi:hypothetical protein
MPRKRSHKGTIIAPRDKDGHIARRRTKTALRYIQESIEMCAALMVELGATKTPRAWCAESYELMTKAGIIDVSLYGSWTALRFRDLDKAKALLPFEFRITHANRFSGKWNLVWADHVHPMDREDQLRQHLAKAL